MRVTGLDQCQSCAAAAPPPPPPPLLPPPLILRTTNPPHARRAAAAQQPADQQDASQQQHQQQQQKRRQRDQQEPAVQPPPAPQHAPSQDEQDLTGGATQAPPPLQQHLQQQQQPQRAPGWPGAAAAAASSYGGEEPGPSGSAADEEGRLGLMKVSAGHPAILPLTRAAACAVLANASQMLVALRCTHLATHPALHPQAQVVDSMRRRADEGHLQLLRQRRLLAQKQELAGRGEAALAQQCRASWCPQRSSQHAGWVAPASGQEAPQLDDGSVRVHSLEAHCAAGQWWLTAAVALPPEWQQRLADGTATASLLAASPSSTVVCRQQQCSLGGCDGGDGSNGGRASRAAAAAAAAAEQQQHLCLTALLDVQQHQQQQAGDTRVDVLLLLQAAACATGSSTAAAAAAAAALAQPTAAPPVQLGSLQLSWQEWLRSYGADQQPPAPPTRQLLSRALAVSVGRLDLACLHSIAQQHLGCTAAEADMDADGGDGTGQRSYLLPSPAAAGGQHGIAGAPAAAVHITQHSPQFAEVQLQAGSAAMLDVLQQQLQAGVQAAAAATGAPAGDCTVAPSLMAPQHAAAAAAAADALVQELDASIEWVEALLKEKLALGSAERRQRAAPDPASAWRAQATALAAAAATDACLLRLLDQP